MKTITTLALALTIGFASAQKMKEAEVPAAVKTKFTSLYPKAKVEKWEKEGATYEAEFTNNKVETSVVFDAAGSLIATEIEIKVSDLPGGVFNYVTKNVPGKKVKEAAKITSASGVVTFEAEIDNADYIFDSTGNFLKKEIESDNDKDDKK